MYNGVDSKEIVFDELRGQIGFVTQDTQLFAGTIRENLLFVYPDASDDDMRKLYTKQAATTCCQSRKRT
jgi:ATP-binding cassette subfamily B protein